MNTFIHVTPVISTRQLIEDLKPGEAIIYQDDDEPATLLMKMSDGDVVNLADGTPMGSTLFSTFVNTQYKRVKELNISVSI